MKRKAFMIPVLIVVGIALLLVFLINPFKKNVWVGFYAPVYDQINKYEVTPEFSSREECVSWINNKATGKKRGPGGYDYWCGFNCTDHRFSPDACEILSSEGD